MRVLIIKTSSMGDVIHTLPALTDAGKAIPNVSFDWVVEENFSEIPAWHPLVNRVIRVAWRRWRKTLFAAATRAEWQQFWHDLRLHDYDVVIDAQGLLKSALLTRIARGLRCGFNRKSARESIASVFYQRNYSVPRQQHAISRIRDLFAQTLNYKVPDLVPDYGVNRQRFISETIANEKPYLVFLHGTTWTTKHWPETYWLTLVKLANHAGFAVKLPWGNLSELERATRIAAESSEVIVLPRLDLKGVAATIAGAKAVVAVDTGLGHLAAALDVPTVSLYGPTNPVLTGTLGRSQTHLAAKFPCAPCLNKICTYRETTPLSLSPKCLSLLSPHQVWEHAIQLLD